MRTGKQGGLSRAAGSLVVRARALGIAGAAYTGNKPRCSKIVSVRDVGISCTSGIQEKWLSDLAKLGSGGDLRAETGRTN